MLEDDNEDEGFLEFPSFESPSELKRLESMVNDLIKLNTTLAEFAFGQAKIVALLDAKLELLSLEILDLKRRLEAKQP